MNAAGTEQAAHNSRKCPKCDTELSDAVLNGQCPSCIVKVIRESELVGSSRCDDRTAQRAVPTRQREMGLAFEIGSR